MFGKRTLWRIYDAAIAANLRKAGHARVYRTARGYWLAVLPAVTD
jgi:hypothetical protein